MESNTNAPPQVLLIDLDNCPKEVEKLPQALADFLRIIVCYGGIDPKVPLSLVTVLATAIHEGKLELVGMKRGGKNAADFGLAFYAGRLVSEAPVEAEFTILSDDTDLDHVVDLLTSSGRKAKRLNGKKPVRNSGNVQVESQNGQALLDDIVDEYLETHIFSNKPRPAKKSTLTNSIKAFPARNGILPETILRVLLARNIVKITNSGKVIYLLESNHRDGEIFPSGSAEDGIPF
ncbi:MAG: hypothetical protein HQL75_09365 [Magnetococcales bacterium]|nr:hypothetical protein [Magnetococcales bacterium]